MFSRDDIRHAREAVARNVFGGVQGSITTLPITLRSSSVRMASTARASG
jgi:hypothetical protein